MRIIGINRIRSGMKLGKPIYSPTHNGAALIKAGVPLTEGIVAKLKELGISCVYIDDELSADVNMENAIDEEVRMKAVQTVKSIMMDLKPKKFDRKNKSLIPLETYRKINNSVSEIIESIAKNKNALFSMVQALSSDMLVYSHMVNVAALSILTAMEMGISQDKVHQIGLGALLHDVGKADMEPDLLRKSSEKLTAAERELLQQHPVNGYSMVKKDSGISAIVKTIILMHHEALDGTGYPLGFQADKINIYVKIVSACDRLDNLLLQKIGNQTIPVYKALEELSSQCVTKIDAEVYRNLVKRIAPYPPGTGVVLNTREKALVTVNNENMPARPIVKVLHDASGNLCNRLRVIDLMKDLTLFIEDTCEI